MNTHYNYHINKQRGLHKMAAYIDYGIDAEIELTEDFDEIETEYWLISKIFVDQENRGNGIAREMLVNAIADMKSKRPDLDIKLWCEAQDDDTDHIKLIAFYESVGFDGTGNGAEMILK